jgi:hypothetical protein
MSASKTTYELTSLNLPKLTGANLKLFTAAVENPASRALLLGGLLENGGIPKLRRIRVDEPPTLYPLVQPAGEAVFEAVPFESGAARQGFPFRLARDYVDAFRRGDLSPVEVAERALVAIEASDRRCRYDFIAVKREMCWPRRAAAGTRQQTLSAGRGAGGSQRRSGYGTYQT